MNLFACILKKIPVLFLLMLCFAPRTSMAGELYFVDAHSQIDHKVPDIKLVLERMDENGVKKTLLASRGKRDDSDITDLAEESGGKVIASIRTKGGKYKKNKPQYFNKLKRQSKSGKFGALAEVIMYHAQKGDKAGEVDIYPSDKRVKAAFKEARRNSWPFVAHIEFAAISGDQRKRYMEEFENMLESNRNHPILLIHMGQLQPDDAERLMSKYTNFHLITSHADSITAKNSSQPWINMFDGEKLKPEWISLMQKYPDRFVFALDNVWKKDWKKKYSKKMDLWREALVELPPGVAAKIAHGNAERLYGLN